MSVRIERVEPCEHCGGSGIQHVPFPVACGWCSESGEVRTVLEGEPLKRCVVHKSTADHAGKAPSLNLCDYAGLLVLADENPETCRMVSGVFVELSDE